ncbi:meiotically up-regulated gene 157 (Mug157) protein [Caulobacter sp. BE264]|nr:hypothetical protein [Caulobacter sp. BE264]MDR7231997.1 meiotically up-regulated gene 157 (Mug157) protein [Caulobacter sp. BE264]
MLDRRGDVVILTGDISARTLRDISEQGYLPPSKPVKVPISTP